MYKSGRRDRSLFLLFRFCDFGHGRGGLEALEQEGGVEHEADGDRDQRVHEQIQLGLSEAILPQPIENFLLRQNVA